MHVIITENEKILAERAVEYIIKFIHKKPDCVLGLATGKTPIAVYEGLISAHKRRKVSFKDVTTFNLDEYIGIPLDHKQSYSFYMDMNFFSHIDIQPENSNIPNSFAGDPYEVSEEYERKIEEKGGIDLQLLGIGSNGHIGFNEPTSSLSSRTRIKTLTPQTIKDNSAFFGKGEFQPTQAITMGIGTIMEADTIILLASGAKKAQAVANMVEGPVSAFCPATALQFHKKTVVIVDKEAGHQLKNKEYYMHVDHLTGEGDNFYDFIGI